MRFLILVLVLAGCSGLTQSKQSSQIPPQELAERNTRFAEDLALLKEYNEGMEDVISYARSRPDLFPTPADPLPTKAQQQEVLHVYASLLNYIRGIDRLRGYWGIRFRANKVVNRSANVQAFLFSYTSWLVQYRHGLAFAALTVPNETMEKLLDLPSAEHGIAAGSFTAFKANALDIKAPAKLVSSRKYFETAEGTISSNQCYDAPDCQWAVENTSAFHKDAKSLLKERGVTNFTFNALDLVRDTTYDTWFPIQKGVSEWMGDTKVRRKNVHLISHGQIDEMQKSMEPGDIIVARHNWYLSNVGLPGFWPHAELYLGTPDELVRFFEDESLKPMLESYGVENFAGLLAKTAPEAWADYQKVGAFDAQKSVIEAISEGVVIRTLYEAAGADYVAVIRPNLTKSQKAQAIVNAFQMWKRPYDFDFDFLTDDEIVCTELVYKAFTALPDSSLPMKTVPVMGRATLPANALVEQAVGSMVTDSPAFSFVYFLDGKEKLRTAEIADEKTFRESYLRPKWDWVQE